MHEWNRGECQINWNLPFEHLKKRFSAFHFSYMDKHIQYNAFVHTCTVSTWPENTNGWPSWMAKCA